MKFNGIHREKNPTILQHEAAVVKITKMEGGEKVTGKEGERRVKTKAILRGCLPFGEKIKKVHCK